MAGSRLSPRQRPRRGPAGVVVALALAVLAAALLPLRPAAAQGTAPAYAEATALVAEGRSAEALARLTAWQPASPAERAQRHWALAALLRDAGRLDDALPHLEALVALRPDVPEFRAALAEVLAALGQAERAAFHRDRAAPAAPAAQPLPLWSGRLSLAIMPQTNPGQRTAADTIAVAGLTATINPAAQARPGTGLAFAAQGAWQPRVAPGLHGRLGADLRGEFHDGTVSDEVTLGLEAGIVHRSAAGTQVEGALTWSQTWRDGAPYAAGPGLRLALAMPVGAQGRATLGAAVQDLRHPGLVGWDGPRTSLLLGYTHLLSPQTALRGTLRLERANARADSLAYTAGTLGIGLNHAFRGGLSLDLDLAQRRSLHDGATAIFGTRREDDRSTLTLRLLHSRVAVAGFAPVVELSLERQRSTIPLYSYENAGVSLGLTRRF